MDSRLIEGDGPFALLWEAPFEAGSTLDPHREGSEWNAVEDVTQPVTTYHYRIFLSRCETYAIRLAGTEVTGVYGPLEYDEVLFSALPRFSYDGDSDMLAWALSNWDDSVFCETEHEVGTIRI